MRPQPELSDLPAELRLLFACINPTRRALDGLEQPGFDWEYVLSMAEWHGVVPLVSKSLSAETAVPNAVKEQLQQSAFATAVRNLHIASMASRLAKSLEVAGIPVISYKGVVLSQVLYGTTAMRPVADIDLIIRPEHFHATVAVLRDEGFADRFGFDDAQRSAVLNQSFEHGFHGAGVNIDVHWRIAQGFVWPSLSMDKAWCSIEPLAFLGAELRVFTPELMLAALCVHAAQDEWIFLKSFADIAHTIHSHSDLDWDKFMSWFGDSHSRRSMVVALQLAHDYLDVPMPEHMLDLLQGDLQAQALSKWVVDRWASRTKPVPEQAQFKHWLFHTRGERFRDRARYVAGVLLRPTLEDFQSASFSPAIRGLYYLVRPFRIAGERLKRAIGKRVENNRGQASNAHV